MVGLAMNNGEGMGYLQRLGLVLMFLCLLAVIKGLESNLLTAALGAGGSILFLAPWKKGWS